MIGVQMAHYHVEEKLGEGGMGEVYRARDTKLNRDVALKILPPVFARDTQRMARFEREAQVLASLNHANIAQIYGLEETVSGPETPDSIGTKALVLELVPGETLQEQIARGPIPVDEALKIALQICDGLEAAHEKGIIHRDLKPANIKITPEGQVKILDFGLAKALEAEVPDSGLSHSPTISHMATEAGVILGTASYMSPEQARGRPVDKRTDIWAFGCVLYEMLTGSKAFGSQLPEETVSDVLAAILRGEPAFDRIPSNKKRPIRRLLQRCLNKDPQKRLRDAGDARIDIEEIITGDLMDSVSSLDVGKRRPFFSRAAKLLLVVSPTALISGLLVGLVLHQPSETLLSATFSLEGPSITLFNDPPLARTLVAISPDGASFVYPLWVNGRSQLHLRVLSSLEPVPIPGTQNGSGPFFSPDGKWIGFFAGGELKKVSVSGGEPIAVSGGSSFSRDACWRPDDTIIFGGGLSGLFRLSASGGIPEQLTKPDSANGELHHGQPRNLPREDVVLFTIATGEGSNIGILSLEDGKIQTILQGGSGAHYLSTGHLLFSRSGLLYRVPFSLDDLEVTGPPAPVQLPQIHWVSFGGLEVSQFSISRAGTFIYMPYKQPRTTLTWVKGEGLEEPVCELEPGWYMHPRLSPEGKRIVLTKTDQEAVGTGDIWLIDLERGPKSLLTQRGANYTPVWTRDGREITFVSNGDIVSVPADMGVEVRPLLVREHYQRPWSWSPDGRFLAFDERTNEGLDVWILPRDGEPVPLLETLYDETMPEFSPDGKWIAYVSNESGRDEVYVMAYPGSGKWHISAGGGREPVWSADGKKLFYRNGDQMMAVDVQLQPTFRAGRPALLFEGQYFSQGNLARNYDVVADADAFLMVKGEESMFASSEWIVVLNFNKEIENLVPEQ